MGKTPMACPPNGTYPVQLGDTCKSIIKNEFDGKPIKLEKANWGLKCCDRALFVGQPICLYTGNHHPFLPPPPPPPLPILNPSSCTPPQQPLPIPLLPRGSCIDFASLRTCSVLCFCIPTGLSSPMLPDAPGARAYPHLIWCRACGPPPLLCAAPNACDKKPCVNGVCIPLPNNKYRCECYPGFQLVQDGYGKPRCIRVDTCPAIGLNPCGVGTCIDQTGQPYSCICSPGYILTSHVDGSAVCAPGASPLPPYSLTGLLPSALAPFLAATLRRRCTLGLLC